MYYHIILTERCNSRCRYCYEKSMKEFDNSLSKKFEFDFDVPCDSEIDIKMLKSFLKADDVIIFYGGEPIVNLDKMIEIMDSFPENKFCMQTNGKLLGKIPTKYMNKFSRILISIDGDKERTDFNRGVGTYDFIMKNVNFIQKNGYEGEIVARMTLDNEIGSDVFEQVKHLVKTGMFDSIHWQIDAGFYEFDFEKNKFSEFVEKYNEEIKKLVDYWIENIKAGNVLKLYPFLGIFESLYFGKKTKLRCGAGYANYTITTNGKIVACPIMNNIKNFQCGHLNSNELKEIDVIEPCSSCEHLDICGGRCLYSNYAKLWPEEGQKLICETIIYLIDSIKERMNEIKEYIKGNIVDLNDFCYEKYFGPEIIP